MVDGDQIAIDQPVPPGYGPQEISPGEAAEFSGLTFRADTVGLYLHDDSSNSWPLRGTYSLGDLTAASDAPGTIKVLTLEGDLCIAP